jgi:hypothetical protein
LQISLNSPLRIFKLMVVKIHAPSTGLILVNLLI